MILISKIINGPLQENFPNCFPKPKEKRYERCSLGFGSLKIDKRFFASKINGCMISKRKTLFLNEVWVNKEEIFFIEFGAIKKIVLKI